MPLSKKHKRKVREEISPIVSGRSRVVAALLAFFLGDLGIHKFYLGQNKQGVIYLILTLALSWTVVVPLIIFAGIPMPFKAGEECMPGTEHAKLALWR